jgi:hypothetical protein
MAALTYNLKKCLKFTRVCYILSPIPAVIEAFMSTPEVQDLTKVPKNSPRVEAVNPVYRLGLQPYIFGKVVVQRLPLLAAVHFI